MKIAIFVLSDPKNGDEAAGRTFNAFATAAEALKAGDQVEIVFQGAGTRWPKELTRLEHPLNGLYNAVRPSVVGASCGCAAVFGSTADVKGCGLAEIKDHALPGTPGVASFRRYIAEGWSTLLF